MDKKSSWFKILLSYADGQRGKFILSVILSVTSIVSGLIPYFCIYNIVAAFAVSNATTALIVKWCGLAVLFYLIKVVLFGLSTGLSHDVAFSVVEKLRLKITDNFLHAPLGQVEKFSIGQIKDIIVDKIENIEPPLAHIVPEGAGHMVLPIVSIIALWMIDWRIALASLVTFPLAIISMMLTFKISGENFTKFNESNAYMNSTIVEYIEGIEVIKAFGRAGVSYEKYSKAIKDYCTFVIKWMSSTWITMKLAFALFPSTILGVLPMSIYLVSRDIITAPLSALAVMLSLSMVTSLARLEVFSESINQMQEIVFELETYLNLERLPEPASQKEIKNFTVSLNDVHFSYLDDGNEVLKGIDLTLPEGSMTALTGPSGSGKSTIAKLISRFWDVSKGSITIGGIDIRDIPLSQLSKCISFVTQDNFLFRTSILENIRMGNPSASDEEVKKAAEEAQCLSFIEKLPDKWNTSAGEAGKRLSGGEKQRIAIARMMIKNAPIVILDEATAFTDPENEDKLQESISTLAKGKTLLVIAHRLSTIKNADNIVVLEKGKISAMGKHQELLDSSPLYKRMWISHIGAKAWAVSVKTKSPKEA